MVKDRTSSKAQGAERRSPTPAAARKRAAIRYLQNALAEDRVILHYQPIVGARDSRIASMEALLRWRRPKEEKATLSDLIWSAERSPAIFRLENWTLGRACEAAAGWQRAGLAGLRVQVNLSAREFSRTDLVGRLTGRLESAGLPPAALGLEITETSSMSELDAVAEHLRRLIAMGMELWLDDFGTGHSSLDWLSRLPLHGLKIAGGFVERLPADERIRVIVTRLIELAHDLGLRVVAEGVENPEQRDFLDGRGCDLLQGYLLYAPMPAAEVPRALAGARIGGPPGVASGTLPS